MVSRTGISHFITVLLRIAMSWIASILSWRDKSLAGTMPPFVIAVAISFTRCSDFLPAANLLALRLDVLLLHVLR